jgi:hypothetical protein
VRIVYSIVVVTMVFLYLLLLLLNLHSIPLLSTFAPSLALITGILLSLPVAFSERILKRFCNRWSYRRFHWVQQFARITFLLSTLYMVGFMLVAHFYAFPFWTSLLYFGFLLILSYVTPFTGFFNLLGVAVLSFRLFLKEYEKKIEDADFGKLLLGANKISKIAQAYNMQVSPHQLALGMTISFLEKEEATRKDFNDLIEWIENPTKTDNFKKFHKLVKKYNSIAEKSAKEGIKERYRWTFERIVPFLGAIIIPIAVAIIVTVVPKILEMLK